MQFPRYSLRMLIAAVTLIGLVLGCVFGGWAEFFLIGLSLNPGETRVIEETVESRSGQWERHIRCYTIDPAEFVLEIIGESETVELVAESHGTPYAGLRWLHMSISIRNGELLVRDVTSGKQIFRGDSPRPGNWPNTRLQAAENVGSHGAGILVAPYVFLHTRSNREP